MGVTTVDITVTNPDGQTATQRLAFTFVDQPLPPPVIVAVEPSSGAPGDIVTISGSGFRDGAAVRFGDKDAAVKVVSADGASLTCVVPG